MPTTSGLPTPEAILIPEQAQKQKLCRPRILPVALDNVLLHEQVPMSFSQLLTEAEVELAPDASSEAAPVAAPGSHDAFTASQHGLPELSGSLDDVGLDCEGLDDLMWDELEDLGLDDASQSGL